MSLASLQHLLLDLDGCVYTGSAPTPRAVESISAIRESGRQVRFCSNNSSRTRQYYADKLTSLGIPTGANEVINSAYATGRYLADAGLSRALVLGEEGIVVELTDAGIEATSAPSDAAVDCVVVGLDRQLSYEKLTSAQRALAAGAAFIATNRDTHLPTERELLPGSGTMVAAVEALAGRPPIVIGKPQPRMVQLALPDDGRGDDRAIMVGDRLDTDIECGNRAGVMTALVLTGFSSADQAEAAPAIQAPNVVFEDLASLVDAILAAG